MKGGSKEATISSGVSIKATPTPESQPRCTLYSNEEIITNETLLQLGKSFRWLE